MTQEELDEVIAELWRMSDGDGCVNVEQVENTIKDICGLW